MFFCVWFLIVPFSNFMMHCYSLAPPTEPPSRPCESREFRCGDGTCIDALLRCDRRYDCQDGTDEFECGN